MLKHLYIRNFAIIDQLEIEFGPGFTVLTGETGAGKSILLGALNLVLGDRADSDSILTGCDHAEIVAGFDTRALDNVNAWLVEKELHADDECILRRRISRDGRSRAYINGTPVTLQLIRELAEWLIDIHGQHEHQSMMKPTVQRQLLDDYAGHRERLEQVSNAFVRLQLLQEQIRHLQQASRERNDRLDLLRFQTAELEQLALGENEYAELDARHQQLAHAESLLASVQQAISQLGEDETFNVQSIVATLAGQLEQAASLDARLAPVAEMLAGAQIQIEESLSELRGYLDFVDLDPQQLAETEQRLQAIHDLARKHQVTPEELYQRHQQLLAELEQIDHADEQLESLQQECAAAEQTYLDACAALTKSRKQAARALNKAITQNMQTLGMAGGKFEICIGEGERRVHGMDKVEFTVTTNSGQPCKPVARVASGGELARISLAIQMIIAKRSRIPSLVFDEVDSGVGGGIADIVGQHLRELGECNQVLCITHLPQVAAKGHQHLRVEKHRRNKQTRSRVVRLEGRQRVEEIARMLSGVEITEQSIANAESMLAGV